jgi:hypothetical protein
MADSRQQKRTGFFLLALYAILHQLLFPAFSTFNRISSHTESSNVARLTFYVSREEGSVARISPKSPKRFTFHERGPPKVGYRSQCLLRYNPASRRL